MSRPKKIHKPIGGSFTEILVAVATGKGKGKAAAKKAARRKRAKQLVESKEK